MTIDWAALSRLVPELAIILVFIFFILERDKRQAVAEEKRDALWREFLKDQREQANGAIGRLAEEIKSLALNSSANNVLLTTHDARAQQFMEAINPAVRRIELALETDKSI